MSESMPRGGGETLHDRLAAMSGEELQDGYDKALDDPQVWSEVMRRMGVNPETVDEDKFSDEQRRKAIETAAEVIREKSGGAPARPSGSESGVPPRGTDSGRPDFGRPFGERGEGGHEEPSKLKKWGLRIALVSLGVFGGITGVKLFNKGVSEPASASSDVTPGGGQTGDTQEGASEEAASEEAATEGNAQEVVRFGADKAWQDWMHKTHEAEDNYEKFKEDYSYYNAEGKSTDYAWMNSEVFIDDLIRKGDIKLMESDGVVTFENVNEARKTNLKEAFRLNKEQGATYMAYARELGFFADFVPEGASIDDCEAFLEGASDEEIAAVLKEWEVAIDKCTFEEVVEDGVMNNDFIRNKKDGSSHVTSSADAESCYCETDETGHLATRVTFENGGWFDVKFSMSRFRHEISTTDGDSETWELNEETMSEMEAWWEENSDDPGCNQPTSKLKRRWHREDKHIEIEITTDKRKTKKDPGRTGMSTGLDGSYVDKRGQNSKLGTKPDETKEVNWDKGGNDGSEGKQKYDKAPDSNTQKGAQDTSEKSQDGTGRSVDQVLADQEQDGAAEGEKKDGKKTAEDESRTQADQKKNDEYKELKEDAEKAGDEYKELKKTGEEREKQSQEKIGDSLDWLN